MDYAYRVECLDRPELELAHLYAAAVARGEGQEFAAVVNEIDKRLKWHPLAFGEPLYHDPNPGIVHTAIHSRLAVSFAINEKKNTVYILSYQALS